MRLPFEIFLALRYLRVHRGRTFLSTITLISVAGVTVGAAALVIALALMTGLQDDVRDRILGGSAHLTVTSSHGGSIDDPRGLAGRITRQDGVAAATPVLHSLAMGANEKLGTTAFAELQGIDPAHHGEVISFPGSDRAFAALRRRGGGRDLVVISDELAANLGLSVGDPVRLFVPRVVLSPFAALPRSRVFEVAATVRSQHYPQDAQRAYVDIDAARTLLDAPGQASWVEVRLHETERLEELQASLEKRLGEDVAVVDLLEQNQEILKALNTEKLILFLAIGLIVVVAALNIVSTLILTVTDKIKDIGALSAMGARPRAIAAVFMLQGLVIGVVGTWLGLAAGALSSWWLDRTQAIELNPRVYYLTHVPFTVRPVDLVSVAVLVLAISLLATIYPAVKAARLHPVEAIRYE